jgi:hypothetical protein
MNHLLERLRYHVTGAIERGESEAIVEIPARDFDIAYSPDDRGWYAQQYLGTNQTRVTRKIYRNKESLLRAIDRNGPRLWEGWK